jgi:hypothetical protein
VIENMNAFNTMVSQLLFVEIKISNEDKCIILLFSLPDLWDSVVVAIGTNTTTLSFDDVVSSLLWEEMRQKNMEGHNIDALFTRGISWEINRSKSSSGRYKSPRELVNVSWRCGKQGHFKKQCRSKSI